MDSSAIDKCLSCGSSDIVRNIMMSQFIETGYMGLEYKKGLVVRGTEPLLADLCRHCGTVLRLHVRNPDRKWVKKS